MEPVLSSHQLLLVNKVWYDILPVERYDVVVIYDHKQKEYLVKRIIGLPNENIRIWEGEIFLDDKPLEDDPQRSTYKNLPNVNWSGRIPSNGYFYIGDNRNDTVFGIVLYEDIRGKVMFTK